MYYIIYNTYIYIYIIYIIYYMSTRRLEPGTWRFDGLTKTRFADRPFFENYIINSLCLDLPPYYLSRQSFWK